MNKIVNKPISYNIINICIILILFQLAKNSSCNALFPKDIQQDNRDCELLLHRIRRESTTNLNNEDDIFMQNIIKNTLNREKQKCIDKYNLQDAHGSDSSELRREVTKLKDLVSVIKNQQHIIKNLEEDKNAHALETKTTKFHDEMDLHQKISAQQREIDNIKMLMEWVLHQLRTTTTTTTANKPTLESDDTRAMMKELSELQRQLVAINKGNTKKSSQKVSAIDSEIVGAPPIATQHLTKSLPYKNVQSHDGVVARSSSDDDFDTLISLLSHEASDSNMSKLLKSLDVDSPDDELEKRLLNLEKGLKRDKKKQLEERLKRLEKQLDHSSDQESKSGDTNDTAELKRILSKLVLAKHKESRHLNENDILDELKILQDSIKTIGNGDTDSLDDIDLQEKDDHLDIDIQKLIHAANRQEPVKHHRRKLTSDQIQALRKQLIAMNTENNAAESMGIYDKPTWYADNMGYGGKDAKKWYGHEYDQRFLHGQNYGSHYFDENPIHNSDQIDKYQIAPPNEFPTDDSAEYGRPGYGDLPKWHQHYQFFPATPVNTGYDEQPYFDAPSFPQSAQNQPAIQSYDAAYIYDLKNQINDLEGIINSFNNPQYVQRPDDKAYVSNLNKQIYDLKKVADTLQKPSNPPLNYFVPPPQQHPRPVGPSQLYETPPQIVNHPGQVLKPQGQYTPHGPSSHPHTRPQKLNHEPSHKPMDAYHRSKRASEPFRNLLRGQVDTNQYIKRIVHPRGANIFDHVNDQLAHVRQQLGWLSTNRARQSRSDGNYEENYGNYNNPLYVDTDIGKGVLDNFKVDKTNKKVDIFDKIFDKILNKIIDKLGKIGPKIFELLVGKLDFDDYGTSDYDNYNNEYYPSKGNLNLLPQELVKTFKGMGAIGIIPLFFIKILSKLHVLFKYLQKFKFFKTFLIPALILLIVAGAIIFLVWWLQPDDQPVYQDYQQQYDHREYPKADQYY